MFKKPQPTLSVLVHTKNDAHTIAACLESCKEIANELIVIDMMSTDQTPHIAKKMGAKVIKVPDVGYVEPARQFGIETTTSDWILILDADEQIPLSLKKKIIECIQKKKVDVFRLPRKNIFLGKWMQHGMQWPDYQVRLFRKGSLFWPSEIHAQPQVFGNIRDIEAQENNAILHYHRTSVDQLVDKIQAQSQQETYYDNLENPSPKEVVLRINDEFSRRFFQEAGYKDGIRGYILAKSLEYYRFLEFAYYMERAGYPEIFTSLDMPLWNNKRQVYELRKELKEVNDSKFYRLFTLYEALKKKIRP